MAAAMASQGSASGNKGMTVPSRIEPTPCEAATAAADDGW
jgi:hypothetical protein